MITLLIILIILFIEFKYRPRFEYVEESSVLILFYSAKNTRKSKIWKIYLEDKQ